MKFYLFPKYMEEAAKSGWIVKYVIFTDKDENSIMGNGLRMFPPEYDRRYRFFDCVLSR